VKKLRPGILRWLKYQQEGRKIFRVTEAYRRFIAREGK